MKTGRSNFDNPTTTPKISEKVINLINSDSTLENSCLPVIIENVENDKIYVISDSNFLIVLADCGVIKKVPNKKFLYLYFSGLHNCEININCKLLRVMFDRCEKCIIKQNDILIGPLDIFKNKDVILFANVELPLVKVEDCQEIKINPVCEGLYLIKRSNDVICFGRKVGKLLWSEQEIILYLISNFGCQSVELNYFLQDIGHHIPI